MVPQARDIIPLHRSPSVTQECSRILYSDQSDLPHAQHPSIITGTCCLIPSIELSTRPKRETLLYICCSPVTIKTARQYFPLPLLNTPIRLFPLCRCAGIESFLYRDVTIRWSLHSPWFSSITGQDLVLNLASISLDVFHHEEKDNQAFQKIGPSRRKTKTCQALQFSPSAR